MAGLANRVQMSVSGTPGTGTITLNAATSGYRSFASAGVPDGASVSYLITDGANWEVGQGTYTASGTTLARTTIQASSNGGSAITASASALVAITALVSDFKVVQRVYAESAARASFQSLVSAGSAVTATSGVQVISANITPTSTQNRLRIEYSGYLGSDTSVAGVEIISVLIVNGSPVSVVTVPMANNANGYDAAQTAFVFEMNAPSTSTIAVAVRVGANGNNPTLFTNSDTAGGTQYSSLRRIALVITEITP